MEKLLKYFPFLPKERDAKQLIIAIVFYVLVPSCVGIIAAFLLVLTGILFILSPFVMMLCMMYTVAGIFFAIMKFLGRDLNELFAKKDEKK